MDTWTPPVPPSPPLPVIVTPRLLKSDFGDGYGAVTPDGINFKLLDPFDLTFIDIDLADAKTMFAFMDAHVGLRFYYTLPFETTARTFRATKHGYTMGTVDYQHTFTVNLQEVPGA